MALLEKPSAIASIRKELQGQYDRMLAAAAETQGYATDQDSKAESKYDTRSLEASYLAMGQAAKVEELAAALQTFQSATFTPFTSEAPIDLGALVEVRYPDRSKAAFFLAARGGGIICDCEGLTLMVVTPEAPLFENLQGKKKGETVAQPPMEIMAVS